MGIGFTLVITLMGAIRELFGNGTLFGLPVLPAGYQPFLIFILPPGAFLVHRVPDGGCRSGSSHAAGGEAR